MDSRRMLRATPRPKGGWDERVVVAASAGGVAALSTLFAGLPFDSRPRTTAAKDP
jgi:hypothetical protein